MELQRYIDILARRKWIILLTMLVTVAVVALGSYLQMPVYAATATVRIAQASSGSIEYVDYVYAERLMNTYSEVLTSRPLLGEVVRRLGLRSSIEKLAAQVEAEVLLNTELLRITVEDPNPARAKHIADTLASLLVEQSRSLYYGGGKSAREILQEQLTAVANDLQQHRDALQVLLDDPTDREQELETLNRQISLEEEVYSRLLLQYEEARIAEATRENSVSIVEPAVLPERPSKPRWRLNLALGALLGLFAGVILAFLLETLHPAIYSTAGLEAAVGMPVLATVPHLSRVTHRRRSRKNGNPLPLHVTAGGKWSPAVEPYRILRANLLAATEGSPRTILVTGGEPGSGKTTVTANLAVTLAQAGRSVIVVDCDLRRPGLHEQFDLPNRMGVAEVLHDLDRLDFALQQTPIPGLKILTAGRLSTGRERQPSKQAPSQPSGRSSSLEPRDPIELLGSEAMASLVRRLGSGADIVLLDSPPALAVADAAVLASNVDGIVLVAARGQATPHSLQRTQEQIENLGGKVLGVVFNQAARDDQDNTYAMYSTKYGAYGANLGGRSQGRLRSSVLVVAAISVLAALVWLLLADTGSQSWFENQSLDRGSDSSQSDQLSQEIADAPGSPTATPLFALVPPAAGKPETIQREPTRGQGTVEDAILDRTPTAGVVDQQGSAGHTHAATNEPANIDERRADTPQSVEQAPTALRPSASPTALLGSSPPQQTPTSTPEASTRDEPTTTAVAQRMEDPAALELAAQDREFGQGASATTTVTTTTSTVAASPTPTQAPLMRGFIPFRSAFIFSDPFDESSGVLRLPANWPVEILEDSTAGATVYGSDRWYLVRVNYMMDTYEGYVPAALVEIEPE